jgi:hypothetical protein
MLRERTRYRWWSRVDRSQVKAAADSLASELEAARIEMQGEVHRVFERFSELDPITNLLVIQAAFADNGGTAAPVDLDGDQLLVFVTFPPAEQCIWPEEGSVTDDGNAKVKKRSAKAIKSAYQTFIECHVIATAREAFIVQPALSGCRVLAMQESEGTPLSRLPVILDVELWREPTLDLTSIKTGHEGAWNSLVAAIQDPESDEDHIALQFDRFQNYLENLETSAEQARARLIQPATGPDAGPLRGGTLVDRFPAVVVETLQLDQVEQPEIGHVDSVANDPMALSMPEFWIEVGQRADEWALADPDNSPARAPEPPPSSQQVPPPVPPHLLPPPSPWPGWTPPPE